MFFTGCNPNSGVGFTDHVSASRHQPDLEEGVSPMPRANSLLPVWGSVHLAPHAGGHATSWACSRLPRKVRSARASILSQERPALSSFSEPRQKALQSFTGKKTTTKPCRSDEGVRLLDMSLEEKLFLPRQGAETRGWEQCAMLPGQSAPELTCSHPPLPAPGRHRVPSGYATWHGVGRGPPGFTGTLTKREHPSLLPGAREPGNTEFRAHAIATSKEANHRHLTTRKCCSGAAAGVPALSSGRTGLVISRFGAEQRHPLTRTAGDQWVSR